MNKQNPVLFYDNLNFYDNPILTKEDIWGDKNNINLDYIPIKYRSGKTRRFRSLIRMIMIVFNIKIWLN